MELAHRYYKLSGKVEPMGFILMILFGLLTSTILGIIYAYIIYYLPFIYLNFFITILYGAAIGLSVGYGGKIGLSRSAKTYMILGLLFGLLGEYVQWSQTVSILSSGEVSIASPAHLFSVLKIIASEGAWSIFGWTPRGVALYLIWLIEGGMIVGIAALMSMTVINGKVFCEKCKKWLTVSRVLGPYQMVSDLGGLVVQFENGNFDSLGNLELATDADTTYLTVDLSMCAVCMQMYLLTVNAVQLTYDSEGKEDKNVTPIVENLIIDRTTYGMLRKLDSTRPVTE
ncbi:MAG TPA: hypothetical protein PK014_07725 [Thermoanaerobaculia bacterium]|nr:hypothetical protein [Thermoanaerobaculia bacterium]HUM29995.1 hypothetical protein [Thermoanaerobaculia bacterium]HXK68316.1 hypothetical protein [Thermoanaerobaculia bacterium]